MEDKDIYLMQILIFFHVLQAGRISEIDNTLKAGKAS